MGAAQRALPGGVRIYMICVYLLKSLKDNKKYIGSTTNLLKRIKNHQNGLVKSTKYRRPLALIGYQLCNNVNEAGFLEKTYKKSHNVLERAIKKGVFKLI
ncbi:MAG TPA: GIY-YIG nuclease family protein [Candidatus Bathyarchaeia archaeon]|nr:GIY-YIG nuclease family protein [Candidatus Bathyarchaeia archaeon]